MGAGGWRRWKDDEMWNRSNFKFKWIGYQQEGAISVPTADCRIASKIVTYWLLQISQFKHDKPRNCQLNVSKTWFDLKKPQCIRKPLNTVYFEFAEFFL